MTHVLAIYEVDRAYGGPEEGGWWYDTGQHRRTLRTFGSADEAYAAARRLNGWLDRLQKHCRDVSSVIYDGGRLAACVFKNHAPAFYPAEHPHYE